MKQETYNREDQKKANLVLCKGYKIARPWQRKKEREREQEMTQITSVWFEKGDMLYVLQTRRIERGYYKELYAN